MLAKTLAIEQLEINALQLSAIKSTAEAFESFSRKTGGVEQIEDAADKLSEHMETLADIDGIIQQSNALPLGFDDDDDDELLEQLAQELAAFDPDPRGPQAPPVAVMDVRVEDIAMPAAPTTPPSAQDAHAVGAAVAAPGHGAHAVALSM